MNPVRAWLSGVLLLVLTVSACTTATTAEPTAAADPRLAVVSEFNGAVNGRVTAVESLAPVSLGFTLKPSGEVQTGEASRARLDLSDGALVRLGAQTSFVLEDLTPGDADNVVVKLQMAFGKIWVSLTGGEIEVETPVGVASVRGSFAVIQYAPNDPANPGDDVLVLDCLEGSCRAVSPIVNEQLGNLERLVLGAQNSFRQQLTPQDVQNFIQENPESARLEATLTAAPPATDTPTPTLTATPTATETIPATETPSPAASATPSATALPPTATTTPTPSVQIIGVHRVQATETIFCIARAYGVLPDAIIQANGLRAPITLNINQPLNIPAVQWRTISAGPVCATQFRSPFPGLPTATPTGAATSTATVTGTPTLTLTPTSTLTPLPAATATATARPTDTATPAPTATLTPSPTATPDPRQGYFWSVNNVSLNGGGNAVTVEPGSPVTVFFDYQVWNAADCPGCIAQIVIGLSNQGLYCAYDDIPAGYPGVSGVSQGSLIAPRTPGTYSLSAGWDLQLRCGEALQRFTGGNIIGTIVVPVP